MQPEEALQIGRLDETLADLEDRVRADPTSAKLRVFLFQLLSIMGDWERALTQLNVAVELDPANLLMAQVCRSTLHCEALRAEVFAGKRLPLVFGQPEEWVGLLVQADQMVAEGKYLASQRLREEAFDAAPATPGSVDGQPFEWIADADSRLGPLLEAIVDGKYYWVPFAAIRQVQIETPTDLRDLVWLPAHFTWVNGGEAPGLIPTRYPGSETGQESAIRLARKTEWIERPGDVYLGLGQRMFATNNGESSLLQVRQLKLDDSQEGQQAGESDNG